MSEGPLDGEEQEFVLDLGAAADFADAEPDELSAGGTFADFKAEAVLGFPLEGLVEVGVGHLGEADGFGVDVGGGEGKDDAAAGEFAVGQAMLDGRGGTVSAEGAERRRPRESISMRQAAWRESPAAAARNCTIRTAW